MSYSSAVPSGGGGFPRLLHAEWTKLRSLRSTWICVALALGPSRTRRTGRAGAHR